MSKKRISYLCLFTLFILLLFGLTQFLWARSGREEYVSEEVETEEEEVSAEETLQEKLKSGDTSENLKVVFLTFSGGPDSSTTDLLNILSEEEVKGTFFINGESADKETLTQIVDDGHTLANYTYSQNTDTGSRDAFFQSINQNEEYITQATGSPSKKIFRYPDGSLDYSQESVDQLVSDGFNYVDWNVSVSNSETSTADDVLKEVVDQVHKNSVSVVNVNTDTPYTEAVLSGLSQAIKQLKSEGYTFMTIEPDYKLTRFKQPTGSTDPVVTLEAETPEQENLNNEAAQVEIDTTE